MKPRRAAWLAALAGLLVPAVCLAAGFYHPLATGAWLAWIWPSSIQLMVLESQPPWPVVTLVVAFSIAINIVSYAAFGWLLAFLYARFVKTRML